MFRKLVDRVTNKAQRNVPSGFLGTRKSRFELLEDRRMLAAYFVRDNDLPSVGIEGLSRSVADVWAEVSGVPRASATLPGDSIEALQLAAGLSVQSEGATANLALIAAGYAKGANGTGLFVPFVGTAIGSEAIVTTPGTPPKFAEVNVDFRVRASGSYLFEVIDEPATMEDETEFDYTFHGFSYSLATQAGFDEGSGITSYDEALETGTDSWSGSASRSHGNFNDGLDYMTSDLSPGDTVSFGSSTNMFSGSNHLVKSGAGSGVASATNHGASISWGYVTVTGAPAPPTVGDFDGDGDTDEDDFTIFEGALPQSGDVDLRGGEDGTPWIFADANGDAEVDADDYQVWLDNTSTFVVSTAVDELDTDYSYGDLSLREALLKASNYTGDGEVRITFTDDVIAAGEIDLTLGQLTIDSDVAIEGPGADLLAIDAQGNSRVFSVSSGIVAAISGLTITGGSITGNGGGIFNEGDLTLDSMLVTGNQSSNRAGGIYTKLGALTVQNSTVADNLALHGGGLFHDQANGSTVEIVNSTFEGNVADSNPQNPGGSGSGGGAYFWGPGTSGSAKIINSTFSGNTTAQYTAGIRAHQGAKVDIINSTITENYSELAEGGIGIVGGSQATLHNTIVVGNTDANGTSYSDASGSYSSTSSYNYVQNSSSGHLKDSSDHNLVGALALLPLGDYGGVTKTHALPTSSLAIDKGSNTVAINAGLSTDQRGQPRTVDIAGVTDGSDGFTDIGAYETGSDYTLLVGTLADEDDADYSADDLSLREAIDLLDEIDGDATIRFSEDLFASGPATILLGDADESGTINGAETTTHLYLDDDVNIVGPGADQLAISGNNATRVFKITTGTTVSLESLEVTQGREYSDFGGGILSNGLLTLKNVKVRFNEAGGVENGGGIYQNGGTLKIESSSIESNYAFMGGGISVSGATSVEISNSTIADNSAYGTGGILIYSTPALITNSTISGNYADAGGGGVQVFSSTAQTAEFINVTIADNDGGNASGTGAGLYRPASSDAEVVLHNTIVAENVDSSGNSDVYGDFENSSSYNLIGAIDTNSTGLDLGTGTETGTASSPLDAGLDVLDYYGGPTRTHRLQDDSLALDNGDNNIVGSYDLVFDQRGVDRIGNFNGSIVDIGAVELAFDEIDF